MTWWWHCETVVRWKGVEGGIEGRNRDEGAGEELERMRKKPLEREGHAAYKLLDLCDTAFEHAYGGEHGGCSMMSSPLPRKMN